MCDLSEMAVSISNGFEVAVTRSDKVEKVGTLDSLNVLEVISMTQMGHDSIYFAYINPEFKT